jgi:outer membrane receptor for ferrienterochelin and colicin
LLLFLCLPALAGDLEGRVVDANTGEAIAAAQVLVAGGSSQVATGNDGRFVLRSVPEGPAGINVSAAGYGLVKLSLIVAASANPMLEIALHAEAARRTESITVTVSAFEALDTAAASERSLNKQELQALSMVLIGDPMRAAQALPGVITNNDFRSEFALRGAGYDRVAVFVDGVLTNDFVHAANLGTNGVSSSEKVSVSLINSETVSEVSLFSGAFPASYGDSSAAVLNLANREGNRVRPMTRLALGILGFSGMTDGPFRNKKGSWLLAGRTTYADYLQRFVERVTGTGEAKTAEEPGTGIDFTDFQARINYDLSPRSQVGASVIFGRFTVDERLPPAATQLERLNRLASHNLMSSAWWTYSPSSRASLQVRGFGIRSTTLNENRNREILDDHERTEAGFRIDGGWKAGRSHNIHFGSYSRWQSDRQITGGLVSPNGTAFTRYEDFARRAGEQSIYLQDTVSSERGGLTLTGGVRADRSGLNGQTVFSPRGTLAGRLAGAWAFRVGGGRYARFPDFRQVFGYFGNRDLRADRATHFNAALERRLGTRSRVTLELYHRADSDQIFTLAEPRVSDGQVVFGRNPFRNSVAGHTRGVEITLQRRSANRVSGWVSYAYSESMYEDRLSGVRFVSDFDQRHTFNAFGMVRLTPTIHVSSQYRFGSGIPWVGFIEKTGDAYVLGDERNTARIPYYGRWDLRVNKAWTFASWKLTLAAEVINVLNRKNLFAAAVDPLRFQTSGLYTSSLNTSFGILPALSIAIDF